MKIFIPLEINMMSIPEEDVNGTVTYDPESDLVIVNRYGVEYTIPPECLTNNSDGSAI